MGTKNLARTIIEGGRDYNNSRARTRSTGRERAHVRDYLKAVMKDPEIWENSFIKPRKKVMKEFHDKLGAVKNWLYSFSGNCWDDVYSQIRKKFDTRTLAGNHIVFDHLLGYVNYRDKVEYKYFRY